MKIYRSINEFLANTSKPGVSPDVKPGISPGTKPKYPSPIRRDKPSVSPQPKAEEILTVKATEDDLAERFVEELRAQNKDIEIYYSAIKKRYSK
jgi:hypothetical protein